MSTSTSSLALTTQGISRNSNLATLGSTPGGVPPLWMAATGPPVVASYNPQPTMTDSPILSSIAPTPDGYPQVFKPAIHSTPEASPSIPSSPTIFTLTVTETLTITVSPASPVVTSQGSKDSVTEWQAPRKMKDLSDFKIASYAGGKDNLEVIQGIPADMAASAHASNNNGDSPSLKSDGAATWDDSGSVIQLLYPAGSINPAQRPIGGAQFYATPLDLTGARNVTLEYSAFFPSDFNWVLGGKMPGLYGGRAGCSGGDAALDCWSTRLMWRKEGKGEMYLYAPKNKQTEKLCGDPQSVCDAAYGFSIGRGSYTWGAGSWTKVRQTVTLNTPGKQDGCFTLDVNNQRVIDRNDIFYRDLPPKKVGHAPHKGGGGLGGLIGGLLSGLLRRASETQGPNPVPTPIDGSTAVQQVHEAQKGWAIHAPSSTASDPDASASQDPQPTAPPSAPVDDSDDDGSASAESQEEPIGFKGLFFSSFFGGHDSRYATPEDQYTYFRGFSMSVNS